MARTAMFSSRPKPNKKTFPPANYDDTQGFLAIQTSVRFEVRVSSLDGQTKDNHDSKKLVTSEVDRIRRMTENRQPSGC